MAAENNNNTGVVAPRAENLSFLADVGDVIRDLSNGRTGLNNAVPQFSTLAPRQSIPVYYMSEEATSQQKQCVMLVLTLGGRCMDTRPSAWQSWVLTWSVACFPELLRQYRDNQAAVDYAYIEFPAEFISQCRDAVIAQTNERTVGDRFIVPPPGLPNSGAVPVDATLVNSLNLEALYAYYAMMVFIMGKSISPENITAISTKRPDALIRKRALDDYKYILTGDGRIHADHYKRIQSGWIRSTQLRITTVRHLARMNANPNRSEILDSVAVNMEMLKNSNQSYLYYIHELLVSCPWVCNIPSLRASYYHYTIMVRVLANEPDYIRPYYKLMMQDAAKEVKRRDIQPLIAVSTYFAAQTKPTMNQYRVEDGNAGVVAAFRTEAAKYNHEFKDIQNQLTTEIVAL